MMRTGKVTLATLGCLLLWMATAAAAPVQKEHAVKVGKKGEIALTHATKAGEMVLQPDTYVVQHRVDKDGNHFVRFIDLKQEERVRAEGGIHYTYTEEDNAGEIKCQVQPATAPINETSLHSDRCW